MTGPTLGALACYLERERDMLELWERYGGECPPEANAAQWDAVQQLIDLASKRAAELVDATMGALASGLAGSSWRFAHRGRAKVAARKWETYGRLFAPRRKKPEGYIGATIGAPRGEDSALHLWFGYIQSRPFRGPRLAERLRNAGAEACVVDRRSGWVSGTVLLGTVTILREKTIGDAVAQLTKPVIPLLVEHQEIYLTS